MSKAGAGKRILVVGEGVQSATVVAALVATGTWSISYGDVAQRAKSGGLWLNQFDVAPATQRAYGPERKGRGGKVRRW